MIYLCDTKKFTMTEAHLVTRSNNGRVYKDVNGKLYRKKTRKEEFVCVKHTGKSFTRVNNLINLDKGSIN